MVQKKLLALTDIETTGLDPHVQEIIEIGLIIVDTTTLEIVEAWDEKITPRYINRAHPKALEVNGYSESLWQHAVPLERAIATYATKTKKATFCAYNVTFDWSFIEEAFRTTGVVNGMDYHRLDLLTMAWTELSNKGLNGLKLNNVAKFLGLPEEPNPHRAAQGVMTAYTVYKRLMEEKRALQGGQTGV